MYVLNKHKTETLYAFRALAMLVVLALTLWMAGVYPFSQKADAANLTSVSDTLSDSDLNVASNHTIAFRMVSGAPASDVVTIALPAGFVIPSGFDFQDIDITANGVQQTVGAANGAAQWGIATTTTNIILTAPSGSAVASNTAIVVYAGTNATTTATGNSQITNPGAGSYEINITDLWDTGATRVAIIDNVVVTAQVDTSFTFTITGLATSSPVNGTTTTKTTTSTAVNFGQLVANQIETAAQRLNVATNAANGFVVTVMEDSNLLSSTGADIDNFADGANTNTPATWTHPTNNVANENTWGHWGITSSDDINTSEFSSNKWISASTTPRAIFSHTGPSDGVTNNIGSSTVGYQVEITALQEAGDDYNTTLTYVATPTF